MPAGGTGVPSKISTLTYPAAANSSRWSLTLRCDDRHHITGHFSQSYLPPLYISAMTTYLPAGFNPRKISRISATRSGQ
jgi:hypothetical protein